MIVQDKFSESLSKPFLTEISRKIICRRFLTCSIKYIFLYQLSIIQSYSSKIYLKEEYNFIISNNFLQLNL